MPAHPIRRTASRDAAETGYAWLDRAALAWLRAHDGTAALAERAVATANATRAGVEANALLVLQESEQVVGAAGLVAPHPMERQMLDLRTYLQQPNPDGALAALGAAIAEGAWTPGSDDALKQ